MKFLCALALIALCGCAPSTFTPTTAWRVLPQEKKAGTTYLLPHLADKSTLTSCWNITEAAQGPKSTWLAKYTVNHQPVLGLVFTEKDGAKASLLCTSTAAEQSERLKWTRAPQSPSV